MNYKEKEHYYLPTDYYSNIELVCTYITEGWAFFATLDYEHVYKLKIQENKLYYFNSKYQTWDNVAEKLTEASGGTTIPRLSYSDYWNEEDFLGD